MPKGNLNQCRTTENINHKKSQTHRCRADKSSQIVGISALCLWNIVVHNSDFSVNVNI